MREQTRFPEASLDDMMEEDAEAEYAANTAHGWGAAVKHDSLVHEQDNVSSSTTVAGMAAGYGSGQHPFSASAGMPGCEFGGDEEHDTMGLHRHDDCASAAVSQ